LGAHPNKPTHAAQEKHPIYLSEVSGEQLRRLLGSHPAVHELKNQFTRNSIIANNGFTSCGPKPEEHRLA
jgi:hypothetical protein